MARTYSLAILQTHPIQYFAPLYQRLAQEEQLDLTVYYCSRQGLERYVDAGFGAEVQWDIDLLSGYRAEFLPNMRNVERINGFFSLVNPGIIQALRRNRHDALWVHGHNYLTLQIAFAAARLLGTALFMRSETHLLLQRSTIKNRVRRPIMSAFYTQFKALLAIGTRNAAFYRYHGVPDSRIHLVPYTVNNDYFISASRRYAQQSDSLRGKYHLDYAKPVILYASKLTRRKHPDHLLQAYRHVREQGVQAQLVYVGSGEEEANLKTYVAQHDVPDVHFMGFRNQSELPAFYALADVFVLPAENEPWGLIINEVMCAGLPVIASAEVGAVPDLVHHGENGYTFEATDVATLGKHLQTLCEDDALRQKMGQRSLDIIQQWSYEDAVCGVLNALSTLGA
jgi:glycosyltransferase involved in cell wall biosynthesis